MTINQYPSSVRLDIWYISAISTKAPICFTVSGLDLVLMRHFIVDQERFTYYYIDLDLDIPLLYRRCAERWRGKCVRRDQASLTLSTQVFWSPWPHEPEYYYISSHIQLLFAIIYLFIYYVDLNRHYQQVACYNTPNKCCDICMFRHLLRFFTLSDTCIMTINCKSDINLD